jgi:hypothetical protein
MILQIRKEVAPTLGNGIAGEQSRSEQEEGQSVAVPPSFYVEWSYRGCSAVEPQHYAHTRARARGFTGKKPLLVVLAFFRVGPF